ncbi:hypothetical protein QI633_20220 [Nocardioides sp. QY071]|uniref:hypothetical protein n=1 Tax=Nocardioides sp. QY071 TaxID=3044187 RepID=UPI002499F4D9|nr:hypothetical protein [Nocardioides sp. QY071]WGY00853.1 hypothetical protein QI633_20220 [Nocardioides sp. QY071]
MDAVAVEVSSGAVVVFGGSRVGVPSEDLGVPQWDASVEGVGDGGVTQRVRADVSRDRCGPGDALDHPVHVTSINRLAGERTLDEWSGAPLTSACLENAKNRDCDWHGGGFVAITD